MKFYRYDEIPQGTIRRSYRNASWRALAAATLFMAAMTAYIALPKNEATNPVFIAVPGLLTLFLGLLMLLRVREGAHKHNWLLHESDAGLYVNLRPAHNFHRPEEAPCVLFVPKEEIGAVGHTVETWRLPDRNGTSIYHWSYIDIYLAHEEIGALRDRLRLERRLDTRNRPANYPVRVVDPPAVRLMWDWIRPAEDAALRLLGEHFPVAPDRKIKHPPWEELDEARKEAVIAELWEHGHLVEAHRVTRIHHKLSARAAWERLQELV